MGRHVFYNNSAFDGNDPRANADDDLAVAPDKQALLPGQTATFVNYTSYGGGINGTAGNEVCIRGESRDGTVLQSSSGRVLYVVSSSSHMIFENMTSCNSPDSSE